MLTGAAGGYISTGFKQLLSAWPSAVAILTERCPEHIPYAMVMSKTGNQIHP